MQAPLDSAFGYGTKDQGLQEAPEKVQMRERVHHTTWANFTLTMSTGGISLLLAVNPHQFRGLRTIGTVIFVLDLVLFFSLSALIVARFILYPGTFSKALHHPTESLFIPTFSLSISTIIANIQEYGVPSTGPWMVVALRVIFWIFAISTFIVAILQYQLLFTGPPLKVQSMTPAWLLPIFPVMLIGTIAGVIAGSQPPHYAIPIIIGGITLQGLGFTTAIFMFSIYIGRLLQYGLPTVNTRPGMFIAVGPPAFTAVALIGMANAALKVFPHTFILDTAAVPSAQIVKILAVFVGIFLWALSLFFFSISVVATLAAWTSLRFHLTWWSFIFPNVGFVLAGIDIGTAIGSQAILWTMSGATVVLVGGWLVVAAFHARAVWRHEIMWPGKDEDRDE